MPELGASSFSRSRCRPNQLKPVLRHSLSFTKLPAGDLDPASGRARLSYRRAAELFTQATAACPSGPWALHQLRHSALTHAAEAGANTATLLAYSGHTSVASLARYARVSPEALARWQQQRDPARRR